MNQDEDEDAFLYGGTTQNAETAPHVTEAVDRDMEQVSEEGEVDDDEEEDSVISLRTRLMAGH
jgi:hypothetical protein